MNTASKTTESIVAPRSWLFVPGDRPDRFDKAVASGCDAVILDLEDAVSAANKESATQSISDWLKARAKRGAGSESDSGSVSGSVSIWVRAPTADNPADNIVALTTLPALTGVVLPKVESAAQLAVWQVPLMAQIETALGILRVDSIAADAPDNLFALAVGVEDLSLSLSCQSDLAGMSHSCEKTIVAARAFGQAVYACPGSIAQFKDAAAWQQTLSDGKAIGSDGALCIHPTQIAPVNDTFAPNTAQVEEAKAIVQAFEASSHAAVQLDGKMLDAPVVERARALLAKAAQFGR